MTNESQDSVVDKPADPSQAGSDDRVSSEESSATKIDTDQHAGEQSTADPGSSAQATDKPRKKILIGSQLGDDETNVKSRDTNTVDAGSSSEGSSDVGPSSAGHAEQTPQPSAVSNQGGEDLKETETVQTSAGTPNQDASQAESIKTALRSSSESTAEQQAKENKEAREAANPPKVQYSIPSTKNVDDEVDQLLGNVSMDELVTEDSVDAELELESRVKATVDKIHNDNVFFNLKGRFVGVASARNFKEPPEPGTMLDVLVKSFNQEDGFYEVSVPGASVDVADWSDLTPGALVEVKVTGSNTGGLECVVNGIRGFIPASQIEIFRVDNFGDYVNRKLQCVVTEANPRRKKLVLSHRAIAEREREEQKKELLASLQPGENREGTVTKLMDFGAFVDIGGAEGLIHISKLSWDRVSHPSEVLKEGEKVSVKVEKIDQQTGKIGLSYRDTQEHPWTNVAQKYPENSTATGVVSKLAQFGAFVKLEPGVEGLVHISEIAHHRVIAVKTHLSVGDEVSVKVVSVDEENQKIGLSIKQLIEKPEQPAAKDKVEEVDEPLREAAVPKADQPLKGGTQKKTGGETFGLNW